MSNSCYKHREKTWVWESTSGADLDVTQLRESGAIWVVHFSADIHDPAIMTICLATGFTEREAALEFITWAYRHYFEHHEAVSASSELMGVDEYVEIELEEQL